MQSLEELRTYVAHLDNPPREYRIAVAALIFDESGKLILQERGPAARSEAGKLEGVGGEVESETDLHEALLREVREELGDVEIAIDALLTVMVRPSTVYPDTWWVVPTYLCRLISGTPTVEEPDKCAAIRFYELKDIPEEDLSTYQQETMRIYREKYGNAPFFKAKA